MIKSAKMLVLQVFTNREGKFGNGMGIVVDEKQKLSSVDRQKITTQSGFSECVFVNDLNTGSVSIFNPQSEIDFSGHALVGAAYYLNSVRDGNISYLDSRLGKIKTWQGSGLTWISASIKNTPPWNFAQLKTAGEVEKLSVKEMQNSKHVFVWSWLDEEKGIISARTFASDWGIPEDEANGSASMQLTVSLGRKLEIHHGRGSVIYTRFMKKGVADLGGRVKDSGV
ncbi:PhzF family phenazine biosynthesis protein [Candidatus Microgenomates bacterium]|nr:PhzF family phenazine biosynthesis protein [Candidatus Microgenomates bacterium]